MIVPITRLNSATPTEIVSVSFSAAHACGEVTWRQPSDQPLLCDFQITAPSGIRIKKLR